MLHHVPSTALQDRLLAEVRRVLRPGATFAGCDSLPTAVFRLAHLFDTMVVVDPATLGTRLQQAGFVGVDVERKGDQVRFRGVVPGSQD
jgi:hypothetical protein